MTFEGARAAIYGRLNTIWAAANPTVPVRYENRLLVDLATETDPFLACEVLFNDGEQISLGITPAHRVEGAIYLAVWVKEDTGTAVPLGLIDGLFDLFKTTAFGGVNTRAPRPLPGHDHKGWYITTLRVPFWFDQL